MKGMKKLSVIALGLTFALSLASCTKGKKPNVTTTATETPTPTETTPVVPSTKDYIEFEEMEAEIGDLSELEQPANYPGIYVNEQNKLQYKLAEIQVRTAEARTKFYLGEEFNADGLLVLARFNKINEDGSYAKDENGKSITILASVKTYFVDSSEVDTSIMGNYKVYVNYRYGEDVKTANYTINVKSSEFETTANLEYVAGIKANIVSAADKKLSPDGRIYTKYCRKDGKNAFTLTPAELNLEVVKNKVNSVASAYSQTVTKLDSSKFINDTTAKKITNADGTLEIDYSAVDTGKVGSYLVRVSYNEGDIVINGKTRSNLVQGFIVVDVIAPIIEMTLEDESFDVSASVDILDLSDYNILVKRQYDGGTKLQSVSITSDKFAIKGVTGYLQGEQNATIESREASEDGTFMSVQVKVKIKPSTTHTITVVTELNHGTGTTEVVSGKTWCYDYKVDDVLTLNKCDITNIADKSRTCEEDGLTGFIGFAKIDKIGGNSYAEFNVTSDDTTLIVYVGSNGDDERPFAIYNEEEEIVYEDVAINKQIPQRVALVLPKGKYKLCAIGSTITFHGYIIATKK